MCSFSLKTPVKSVSGLQFLSFFSLLYFLLSHAGHQTQGPRHDRQVYHHWVTTWSLLFSLYRHTYFWWKDSNHMWKMIDWGCGWYSLLPGILYFCFFRAFWVGTKSPWTNQRLSWYGLSPYQGCFISNTLLSLNEILRGHTKTQRNGQ